MTRESVRCLEREDSKVVVLICMSLVGMIQAEGSCQKTKWTFWTNGNALLLLLHPAIG